MKNLVYLMMVLVLAVSLTIVASPAEQSRGQSDPGTNSEIEISLPQDTLSIQQDSQGMAKFDFENIQYLGETGAPSIPYQAVTVLLPPETDLSTVSADIENPQWQLVPGNWDISPITPISTWDGDTLIEIWPEDKDIVDGMDIEIYESDSLYPYNIIAKVDTITQRQYQTVQVIYAPYQYNPVSKQLYQLTGGQLIVSFNIDSGLQPTASGAVGLESVSSSAANFSEAIIDYDLAGAPSTARYVIITTDAIEGSSTALANFVAHKEARGFTVQVVTDSVWGGGTGDTAAENLRSWLQANYLSLGIEYLLLVGDPHPLSGDVPMKMCYPQDIEPTMSQCPTDFYYADLSDDWNHDGDAKYGEFDDDFGANPPRGAELAVGRIPVYSNDIAKLDGILNKIISYENSTGSGSQWRQNVLLPMESDGGHGFNYQLGEEIKNKVLEPINWDYYRIYDECMADCNPCSRCPIPVAAEGTPCTVENVYNAWNGEDFGAIFWMTHGSEQTAAQVMDVGHAKLLSDDYPGFTFQGSCHNGCPENPENLAYTLLDNACINTIGASRESWFDGHAIFEGRATTQGFTYEYAKRLISDEKSSGDALNDLKLDIAPYDERFWMNYLTFNIYGCPATGIFSTVTEGVIYNDHTIDDSTGNNNGIVDTGESILLDVTLLNAGTSPATSVSGTLSTTNSYIEITDSAGYWGNIPAGGTSTQSNVFAFDVANDIPDQNQLDFIITTTTPSDSRESGFRIIANAPELSTGYISVDDSAPSNNNDGTLDPGETVQILVPTLNTGHSDAPDTNAELSCISGCDHINIDTAICNLGTLTANAQADASFTITASGTAPDQEKVVFGYSVTSGNYSAETDFPILIGGLVLPWVEGFEEAVPCIITSDTDYIEGLPEWSYDEEDQNPNGRLRFCEYYHTGTHAATFDIELSNFSYTDNWFIAELPMSGYENSAYLELSFFYMIHNYINSSTNGIWIRGNASDPWINIYSLYLATHFFTDYRSDLWKWTWHEVDRLDIDAVLAAAGQHVSPQTQLLIRVRTNGNDKGLSIDDIRIEEVFRPSATTLPATDVTSSSATLHGSLDDLAGSGSVDVSFVYGVKKGGPYPYETGSITLISPGTFTRNIPVNDGEECYFRAKVTGNGLDGFGEELTFTPPGIQEIIYVNEAATGNSTGVSWEDAYTSFHDALDDAGSSGDQIWVASGTYYPTRLTDSDDARSAAFHMKGETKIYGGFPASGSPSWNDRDWSKHKTVFSGDIGVKGDNSDNCYHVFFHDDAFWTGLGWGSKASLDGFIITGGNANGETPNDRGGGLFGEPYFNANFANCTITGNSAVYGGGVWFWHHSDSCFSNCLVTDNTASESGGGIYIRYKSSPKLSNCTFVNNSAGSGAAIYNEHDVGIKIYNSIIWGNGPDGIKNSYSEPEVMYSDVQMASGVYSGTGNINADPGFVNSDNGDFRLMGTSPCIDTGDASLIPWDYSNMNGNVSIYEPVPYDFEGNPRVINGTVDMGAYERVPIFVNDSATGASNGTSWEDAFTDLQDALDTAMDGSQIWVASGTYMPSVEVGGTGERYKAFQMKDGVALYGGFSGTEIVLNQRNWVNNVTVLSGDIGIKGDESDNCYHVFFDYNDDIEDAILDGFTISGGNADHPEDSLHARGGGMYVTSYDTFTIANCLIKENSATGYLNHAGGIFIGNSPAQIHNCTFEGNITNGYGGGIYAYYAPAQISDCAFKGNYSSNGGGLAIGNAATTVTNCTFSGNYATMYTFAGDGGGMFIAGQNQQPVIRDCIFENNVSCFGGGICNRNSSPIITNCIFTSNEANTHTYGTGGGIYNYANAAPSITNCTLYGNLASTKGGGIYSGNNSSSSLINCILWANTPVEIYNDSSVTDAIYSDIQGGYAGVGNISELPIFVNPGSGNFHLQASSPCINAGSNSAPYLPEFDFEGDDRIIFGVVDMGVDELGPIFVKSDATGANDGTSWSDAYTDLQSALDIASNGDEIWVASGTYTPSIAHGGTGTRYQSFQLKTGVEIYGGFPSSGNPSFGDRDWDINVATLSGDIGVEGDNSDNCYHVFYHPDGMNPVTDAVLDGFTINGGNANGSYPHNMGGGFHNKDRYHESTIQNCIFKGNSASASGAGIFSDFCYGSFILKECIFSQNSASSEGGGIRISGNPVIEDCYFLNNTAALGGGIAFNQGSAELSNCVFNGNYSTSRGGAVFAGYLSKPIFVNCTFDSNESNYIGGALQAWSYSEPTYTNCTFANNSADNGNTIACESLNQSCPSSVEITNCILWNGGNEVYNADVNLPVLVPF